MPSRYRFRDCHSTRPGDVHPNDAFAIKVVAVAGRANDWAAYKGPTLWSDEKVARKGCKLPIIAAQALFPVMHSLVYRR